MSGSVINSVYMVINGYYLVRIRYRSLSGRGLFYGKNEKNDAQTDNKRNERSTKIVKSEFREFHLDISGIKDRIISLYARRMTTRDIGAELRELYGIDVSAEKVSKTKSVFLNDSSLEKMLYLASMNVIKKWKMRYRNWDLVLSQLSLLYDDSLK